jgi:hypothetical protein
MRCFLLTILITVLPFGSGEADFQSGNQLWAACNQRPRAGCVGYVEAIADVLFALEPAEDFLGWRACMPQTLTGNQAVDVVLKHLRNYPEQRHFGAAGLVAHALTDGFPCRSQ